MIAERCPASPFTIKTSNGRTNATRLYGNSRRFLLLLSFRNLLDRLPTEAKGGKEYASCSCDCDVVGVTKTEHVGLEDCLQSIGAAHLLKNKIDLGSATVNEDMAVNADVVCLEIIDKPVLEGGLRDGNEYGAT